MSTSEELQVVMHFTMNCIGWPGSSAAEPPECCPLGVPFGRPQPPCGSKVHHYRTTGTTRRTVEKLSTDLRPTNLQTVRVYDTTSLGTTGCEAKNTLHGAFCNMK
jgi:hypothetical protein